MCQCEVDLPSLQPARVECFCDGGGCACFPVSDQPDEWDLLPCELFSEVRISSAPHTVVLQLRLRMKCSTCVLCGCARMCTSECVNVEIDSALSFYHSLEHRSSVTDMKSFWLFFERNMCQAHATCNFLMSWFSALLLL